MSIKETLLRELETTNLVTALTNTRISANSFIKLYQSDFVFAANVDSLVFNNELLAAKGLQTLAIAKLLEIIQNPIDVVKETTVKTYDDGTTETTQKVTRKPIPLLPYLKLAIEFMPTQAPQFAQPDIIAEGTQTVADESEAMKTALTAMKKALLS